MAQDDFDRLSPHLNKVSFAVEEVLIGANMPIEQIYFLDDGIASVVTDAVDDGRTEVGIIGRDGFVGKASLLDAGTSPHMTFIQVGNAAAYAIDVARFRDAIDASRSLRNILLRYVHTFGVQVATGSFSNARHRMEARLARWLLMCHDRVDGDDILLTHEFMSVMIAAQRTGVTVTLHILEGTGAIRSTRGKVTVVDRAMLKEFAGSAYGTAESEYGRLIAPLEKP